MYYLPTISHNSWLTKSEWSDPMQLVDELSMIYTTSIMFYSVFSFSKSRLFRQLLAMGLVCLSIFITVSRSISYWDALHLRLLTLFQVYYHYLQDPDFHQNAFALLTIIVVGRSCQVMEFNIRPSLRSKYATAPQRMVRPTSLTKSQRAENDRKDEKILRDMWLMVIMGLTIFLTGFGIWSLDNHYCKFILMAEANVWQKLTLENPRLHSKTLETPDRFALGDIAWGARNLAPNDRHWSVSFSHSQVSIFRRLSD